MTHTEYKLMQMRKDHPESIAIFGGAYHAVKAWERGDLASFVGYLQSALELATTYHWHETQHQTAVRFCNLCGVDIGLAEVYLGVRLF